uniref:HTH psq-type domain-containing protein n=2 Tax=Astyanax mexicanus TaxID=7994 RepID=A0A3B1KC60_ASTMX
MKSKWSKKFRVEVIAFFYEQREGYKPIGKILNISRDTTERIIWRFKAKDTVETIPGCGRNWKRSVTAGRYLKLKVEKNPQLTAEEL